MEYSEYFLTALQSAEKDTQSAEEMTKATERQKTEILRNEISMFWELFRVIHENYTFGKEQKKLFQYGYHEEDYLETSYPYFEYNFYEINLLFSAQVRDDFKFLYWVQETDKQTRDLFFADFETFVRYIAMRVMQYKTKN